MSLNIFNKKISQVVKLLISIHLVGFKQYFYYLLLCVSMNYEIIHFYCFLFRIKYEFLLSLQTYKACIILYCENPLIRPCGVNIHRKCFHFPDYFIWQGVDICSFLVPLNPESTPKNTEKLRAS